MNRMSRKVMTIDGFPIFVDVTFLLLAALFVFPQFGNTFTEHFAALLKAPILFVSIVLHELGHAWAIRRFGYGKSKVLLWGMGGLCIGRGTRNDRHGLWISLAGPLAGLALGLPMLGLWMLIPDYTGNNGESLWLAHSVLQFTVFVNVGWSLLNLLPIFPLDGGKVLTYLLRIYGKMDRDKSLRRTGLIGLILCVPLLLLSAVSGQIFTVVILFFIAQGAWQAYKRGTAAVNI